MLESLQIEGYAIIDELTLELEHGLTILSGETGAGKSILIGALSLVLGERGDTSMVRAGAEASIVSGVVRIGERPEVSAWLAERGIQAEDGKVIIRRILKKNGRGAIYLQSTPMTRGDTKEFTSLFFDVHGQHEHQSLLRVQTHRELIDRFGGLEERVTTFRKLFVKLSAKRQELESLESSERDRLRELDMLSHAVREIDSAGLSDGEEEQLGQEARLLSQAERLFRSTSDFHDRLAESRGGALASIRQALGDLSDIGSIVDELKPLSERLESAFYDIEDIAESVRNFQETVDFSPGRLDECEQRLAEIRRLEKKYGDTVAEVLAYGEDARGKLDRMEHLEDEKTSLTAEISEIEQRLKTDAQKLSNERKNAADTLQREIGAKLDRLGMEKSTFTIRMNIKTRPDGRPVYTQFGVDNPEFLIASNEGEPPRPLKDIASGGEMSRIMLAIKSVLADSDSISTLIFDEIDAGIGGSVAVAVGEHLAALADSKQVLCITHLPTIAVRADHHFSITKEARGDRTVTGVREVFGEDRVSEIARMLSGDAGADTSRSHARELLTDAGKL